MFEISFDDIILSLYLFSDDSEILVTGKRNAYHEVASKKMRNFTHSQICKVDNWPKLVESLEFKVHRPSVIKEGIHTTLLHEAFGRFVDTNNSTNYDGIDAADFEFTHKFCTEMSKFYTGSNGEDRRRDIANELLCDYLGKTIVESLAYKGSSSRTDGTLFTSLGNDVLLQIPIAILEVEVELGLGGGDPTMEGLAYYVFTVLHGMNPKAAQIARQFSVVPLLLLSIVGPYIAFNFVAAGETFVLDPATSFLPCLVLPFDIKMMEKTARTFRAMKECIQNLHDFYSKLSTQNATNPRCEQLSFPYIHDFEFHDEIVHFDYDERRFNKLVFFAHVTSEGAEIPKDTMIAVKFTRTYSPEAHMACWNYFQSISALPLRMSGFARWLENGCNGALDRNG